METNFEKVQRWNSLVGVPFPKNEGPNIEDISLAVGLVEEELYELEDEIFAKDSEYDIAKIKKELGDLIFVVYGLAHRMGIDADDVLWKVWKSNMTKFCSTEEQAKETVLKYEQEGVDAYYMPMWDYFIVRRTKDDKVLKGINYEEPAL